jgi:hypothetical protein
MGIPLIGTMGSLAENFVFQRQLSDIFSKTNYTYSSLIFKIKKHPQENIIIYTYVVFLWRFVYLY